MAQWIAMLICALARNMKYEKFFECTEDYFVLVIHRRRRTESTYHSDTPTHYTWK